MVFESADSPLRHFSNICNNINWLACLSLFVTVRILVKSTS